MIDLAQGAKQGFGALTQLGFLETHSGLLLELEQDEYNDVLVCKSDWTLICSKALRKNSSVITTS